MAPIILHSVYIKDTYIHKNVFDAILGGRFTSHWYFYISKCPKFHHKIFFFKLLLMIFLYMRAHWHYWSFPMTKKEMLLVQLTVKEEWFTHQQKWIYSHEFSPFSKHLLHGGLDFQTHFFYMNWSAALKIFFGWK